MNTTRTLRASLATLALLAAGDAAAQSDLLPTLPAKGIALEASRPNFELADLTPASTVLFLSGRVPLTGTVSLVGDIPFVHARFDGEAGELFDGGATVVGNPRIGVQYRAAPSLSLEAAVRLPLTSADSTSVGDVVAALANPLRMEAFVMDAVPVSVAVTWERALAGAFSLRARAGGTSLFYTGDDEDVDTVRFLDYGVFGGYTAGAARLGLGVNGRFHATADEGSFADRSLHFAGATVDYRVAGVRPGISVQLPFDNDYREVVGPSFGVYLQVPLR